MKILPLLVSLVALVISGNSIAYTNYQKSHYYAYKVKEQYLSKVCFQPASNLSLRWERALAKAVNSYNTEFPSWMYNLHFAYAPYDGGNCSYTVTVNELYDDNQYNPYNAITTGCHSFYKKPCDFISINTANAWKVYSPTEQKGLIMHEMGHVIGMNHTGGGGGNKIPNSHNDSEPQYSVMKGGGQDNIYDDEFIPSAFTLYDIKAFRFLYGKW